MSAASASSPDLASISPNWVAEQIVEDAAVVLALSLTTTNGVSGKETAAGD